MQAIKRAWKGQEKLWKVWWLYGVLVVIALALMQKMLPMVPLMVFVVVRLLYSLWWYVAAWRCAWNASAKFWGILVRILVVLSAVGTIGAAVMMFTGKDLSGGKSREWLAAAKCRQQMSVQAEAQGIDPSAYIDQHRDQFDACTQREASLMQGAPLAPVSKSAEKQVQIDAKTRCEESLRQNAIKNNADPDSYIAQNQSWVQQCMHSEMGIQ